MKSIFKGMPIRHNFSNLRIFQFNYLLNFVSIFNQNCVKRGYKNWKIREWNASSVKLYGINFLEFCYFGSTLKSDEWDNVKSYIDSVHTHRMGREDINWWTKVPWHFESIHSAFTSNSRHVPRFLLYQICTVCAPRT